MAVTKPERIRACTGESDNFRKEKKTYCTRFATIKRNFRSFSSQVWCLELPFKINVLDGMRP